MQATTTTMASAMAAHRVREAGPRSVRTFVALAFWRTPNCLTNDCTSIIGALSQRMHAVLNADFLLVALVGHGAMSDLSPLSAAKRTSRSNGDRSAFDPKRTLDVWPHLRFGRP